MKRLIKKMSVVLCLLLLFLFDACQANTVTLETLLDEMVNREKIARLPEIPFSLKQFSSYDRRAIAPDQPGWFANSDSKWFIREEINQGRKEYVMMDAEGPGAVVRIWMTFASENSGKGILRFYFDGNPEPVIEGTAFDILSGNLLVGEPLASSVSDLSPYDKRGHNLYLPLPYAKSCKITYQNESITAFENNRINGESVYYNINYRTYESGTTVETFHPEQLQKAKDKITEVQEKLQNRYRGLDKINLSFKDITCDLSPKGEKSIQIQGGKAIRHIRLSIKADRLPEALRTIIVKAEFDNEKTIWCPVGDFFGTGYQIRPLNTWYAHVEEDGTMDVYWIMPFEKSANLSFSNIGDQTVKIIGEIGFGDWEWDNKSMHFGVSWHQYTGIFTRKGLTANNPGEPLDLNYVALSGKGIFVGDGLTLFNTSYMWWGEGDEKIYVDNETFPSHFGTGTEDYYGYAWGGRSNRFSNHPFIAQPDESGDWKPGYVVNLRHRSLDIIPFEDHLKVDMELWHWHSTWVNYAPTTFWYMRPGGKSNQVTDVKGALAKVALQSTDIIPNQMVNGIMEAEYMTFHNSCGNKRGSMSINPFGNITLGNNLQVMWSDGMPGDSIFFAFQSLQARNYNLTADFTVGPKFGNFSVFLNNRHIKDITLFDQKMGTKKVHLGNINLKKGDNILLFTVNPSDGNEHIFGIDRIQVNK